MRNTRKKKATLRRKATQKRTQKRVTRRRRVQRKKGGSHLVAYPITIHKKDGSMMSVYSIKTDKRLQFQGRLKNMLKRALRIKDFRIETPHLFLSKYVEYAHSVGFSSIREIQETDDIHQKLAGLIFITKNANFIVPNNTYSMKYDGEELTVRFHTKFSMDGRKRASDSDMDVDEDEDDDDEDDDEDDEDEDDIEYDSIGYESADYDEGESSSNSSEPEPEPVSRKRRTSSSSESSEEVPTTRRRKVKRRKPDELSSLFGKMSV